MARSQDPVKSLLVSWADFPPQGGGISRLMAALTTYLAPDEICCLTGVPRDPANPGVPTRVPGPRIYRRPAAFAKPRHVQMVGFGLAISEIMLREWPRLVQLATLNEGFIGLWLLNRLHLPFLVYAHGNEILNSLKSSRPKAIQVLTHAARVLAVSRFTAELIRSANIDPMKIEVVHPGCDIDRFVPREAELSFRKEVLGTGRMNRVIVSVGRLVKRKGHDMVIRALPQIVRSIPNLTYLIVGDGPCRLELDNLASCVGVRQHVVFLGHVSDEALPRVYALGDVFAMPSREEPDLCDVEGFGLVYLEANACGKPVLAGRSGGVEDAVVDGVTGLLVDPSVPEAVAKGLSQILESPELAQRLGQQGRARVLREFTWTHFANRIRNIAKAVDETHRGRRR